MEILFWVDNDLYEKIYFHLVLALLCGSRHNDIRTLFVKTVYIFYNQKMMEDFEFLSDGPLFRLSIQKYTSQYDFGYQI